MRRYVPLTTLNKRTPCIIKERVEICGQFIRINDILWNVINISDIRLSEDKLFVCINSVNNEEAIYEIDQNSDANVLFEDICEKFKSAKRLHSYQ